MESTRELSGVCFKLPFIRQAAGDTVCTVWQFVELCASDVSFTRCMLDVCSLKCFDAHASFSVKC